jgi:hypothetical protein
MKHIKLFEQFLNEALSVDIEDIHFETDPKKQEELKIAYGKSTGERTNVGAIDAADYALKRFRKEIKFGDGTYLEVFIPGSHDAMNSTLGNGPHSKSVKAKSWNSREYTKWIKDIASNGGANNAFDMAQNAKNEPGLIDWVKKNNRGENPLDRIQWDIEAFS